MIDLDGLEPEFRIKLVAVIRECIAAGVQLNPIVGEVSIVDQAKGWRRSSTDVQIDQAIYDLKHKGCEYLSNILTRANAPVGTAVTNKLPGYSWHNYGEEVEFDVPADKEMLSMMRKIAKKHDLTVDVSFLGNVSIRKSPFASPLEVYKPEEIDQLMQEKWGS